MNGRGHERLLSGDFRFGVLAVLPTPFIVGECGVQNKVTRSRQGSQDLPNREVNDPTAAYMLAAGAAVVKDFLGIAAGFFEGVGQ